MDRGRLNRLSDAYLGCRAEVREVTMQMNDERDLCA